MNHRRTGARGGAFSILVPCLCALLLTALGTLWLDAPTASADDPSDLDGCPLFPAGNIWTTRVDDLPLDPGSDDYVAAIGADRTLHPDFGSGEWEGGPIGIPYDTVTAAEESVAIVFDVAGESDPGPYPIPTAARIEGGADSDGDRHVLVLDTDSCLLYELFYAFPQSDGSWMAGSGAVFDLNSHALRPEMWTSADAAGLPILPGLIRYDEVASGEIGHAIRFTAPQTQRAYVWPARHFASDNADPAYPPLGQRFRLKQSVDISGLSAPVRTIARAMQQYGVILADNGSAWYISGAPDERWNNDLLRELKQLTGADFEAVDVSGLIADQDSGRVRTTETPTATWTATALPTETPAATASPPSGQRRLYLPLIESR